MKAATLIAGVLLGLAAAAPAPSANIPFKLVHQFPNGTWIENMAIRANGQIMATNLAGYAIYLVDPKNPQTPSLVHQFPNRTAVAGIAELETNLFYTVTSIADVYELKSQPNSTVMWEVDMRQYARTGNATVRPVAHLPAVGFANGLCELSAKDGTLLIGDSTEGKVWRANVRTGQYAVTFDDPSLKPIATDQPSFGANGVHVVGSTLYYANTNKGLIGTVSIAPDGTPTGPPKILTSKTPDADDFAVDKCGNVWLAENVANTLVRVSPDGQVQTVATQAGSNAFFGPVRAALGRGADECGTLFVSTDGLEFNSTGGIVRSDGKIVAFDISKYCS